MNHGDGSWGSGTCPQCGDHEYTGQSCTTGGTCVCGATAPALGHNLYGVTVSFDNHPHCYYKDCSRCGEHVYTGGHGERPHGDGTGATCKDCGEHSYYTITDEIGTSGCDCGVSIINFNLVNDNCRLYFTCNSVFNGLAYNTVPIWNGYKPDIIQYSPSQSVTTVHVCDVYDECEGEGVVSYYARTTPSGLIQMNRYFCDGREEVYNFKTMIHEFGHALGLGHCPSGGDVMSTGNVAVSTLSQFDMDSYDAAYELYSVY